MTDKKNTNRNQKRIITGKTQSRGSTGTEPCERAKCPDTQADSGGCRLESIFPEFQTMEPSQIRQELLNRFKRNLTLVDTSNFSSRRAHLLTT